MATAAQTKSGSGKTTKDDEAVNTSAPKMADVLETMFQEHQAKLFQSEAVSAATQVTFPESAAVTDTAITESLKNVEAMIGRCGRDGARGEVVKLLDQLESQLARVRGYRKLFESDKSLARKPPTVISEAAAKRVELLTATQKKACMTLLRETTPQREAINWLAAFFATTNAVTRELSWVNGHAVTNEVAKARGEVGFLDLPKKAYVRGTHMPFFEISVDETGSVYHAVFQDARDMTVWSDRGSMIVLCDELRGRLEAQKWGALVKPSLGVVVGNIDRTLLGEDMFTDQTEVALRQAYVGDDPALKHVLLTGNPPVVAEQSAYGLPPLVAPASALFGGSLVHNDQVRSDLSFTHPPTNPKRDKVKVPWLQTRLLCRDLRNQEQFFEKLPMALLKVVSNEQNDATNIVFSSSKSLHDSGSHTIELQLAEALATAISMHKLGQFVGLNPTAEEVESQGMELNAVLVQYSGPDKPFLRASCDAKKSTLQEGVQRDDKGEPILDADGNTIPTGKMEAVHYLSINYREGLSNFIVVIS